MQIVSPGWMIQSGIKISKQGGCNKNLMGHTLQKKLVGGTSSPDRRVFEISKKGKKKATTGTKNINNVFEFEATIVIHNNAKLK